MGEHLTPLDGCRRALADSTAALAATLPPGRAPALRALLRAAETLPLPGESVPAARPGWTLALRLCLDRPEDGDDNRHRDSALPVTWAEHFLADCDQLALAALALAQCAAGHLQMQQRSPHTFVAWAASRSLSPEQRERADVDWWAAHVAQQVAPRLVPLLAERDRMRTLLGQDAAPLPAAMGDGAGDPAVEGYYRRLGEAHAARFAYQHTYPADAVIGGVTVGQYTAVLALLISWLHRERDRRPLGEDRTPTRWDEQALVAALATALDADQAFIGRAMQPFILDRANAAYHSALPGGAAPPLIRLDAGRVVASVQGLLGEPLLFLMRELRRRHGQEYHTRAHLREGVFRQDLYNFFDDRRFVRSAGAVELKRSGAPRTDIDALVFDRTTGTLGVFELKAQDPFARSVEERQRQHDSFLQANRQVAAILEWVQRRGGADLLSRVDAGVARRVQVHRVHVFVLGRYLAHVAGGPALDGRAAWGNWPQVLQVVETGAIGAGQRNPLGALFTRLRTAPPVSPPASATSQSIAVGDLRLRIYPSFAAMKAEEDRQG